MPEPDHKSLPDLDQEYIAPISRSMMQELLARKVK